MLLNLFEKKKKNIKKGASYAVLRGDYHGEIFVFFKQIQNILYFVSLPKMQIREVDFEKFEIGLKEKIIDFVDIIPQEVYNVVEKHGKNTLNK